MHSQAIDEAALAVAGTLPPVAVVKDCSEGHRAGGLVVTPLSFSDGSDIRRDTGLFFWVNTKIRGVPAAVWFIAVSRLSGSFALVRCEAAHSFGVRDPDHLLPLGR